jgi:hypothetical protein
MAAAVLANHAASCTGDQPSTDAQALAMPQAAQTFCLSMAGILTSCLPNSAPALIARRRGYPEDYLAFSK